MAPSRRVTSTYSSASTANASHYGATATTSWPHSGRLSTSRPRTSGRPRTGTSTIGGVASQNIICAVSESRGVSPTVGIAFVNLSTSEVVLSQINDSKSYVRTILKLQIFEPSCILMVSTAVNPRSTMCSIIEENVNNCPIVPLERKYWAEIAGLDYIQQLAFAQDVEAIKIAIGGNYFATCCFAAAIKHIDLALSATFSYHSLRIKYEPPEGTMMIDLPTIRSLELIQNLQNTKSRDCLFGLLNETLTPMGSRMLRSSILQPSLDLSVLQDRLDTLEELVHKEEMFMAIRQALKPFQDVDKLLTALITIPTKTTLESSEQAINNIILLKHLVNSVKPVYEALAGAKSRLLVSIRNCCVPAKIEPVQEMIHRVINRDVAFSNQPLDLLNQRTHAVESGVNGLLDVARQTFHEAIADVYQDVSALGAQYDIVLETKYDSARRFYIRIQASQLDDRELPPVFVNVYRKKGWIECQTLGLVQRNQKIGDSHTEVILMSDKTIVRLIEDVRDEMHVLFRLSDSLATLDMIASFGQLVTSQGYVRPEFTDTLAIKGGRHPIREKIHAEKFVPNDVYATQQSRLQIITGCNMSGKSTYIRMIALLTVMAQIGCFVPAQYASFPVTHQLFSRVSLDDSAGANISTFASEMRETAFILRNVNPKSMAIIDELGRGTSTRDGLAIAISVAEALVGSKALIWFATHFRDLANILAERNGVVNLHLAVIITDADRMTMLYKISDGCVQDKQYGLALARVVDLPPAVLEVANAVSAKLNEQISKRRERSKAVALAQRRKLILTLRETLVQARDGKMEGKVLAAWLRKLQAEFVHRMSAIDKQIEEAGKDATQAESVHEESQHGSLQENAENSMTWNDPMVISSGESSDESSDESITAEEDLMMR